MSKNLKTIILSFTVMLTVFLVGGSAVYAAKNINYDFNGGNPGRGNFNGEQVLHSNSNCTANLSEDIPTKIGYDFAGWLVNETLKHPGDSVTGSYTSGKHGKTCVGDVDAVAQWTAHEYDVTLNLNYEEAHASTTVKATYGAKYVNLTSPERVDYDFAGWYTQAQGGDLITTETTVAITRNTTLYAHWTIKTFTIDTSVDGENGTITADTDVNYGSNFTVEFTPNLGYYVSEVYVDSVKVDAEDILDDKYTFVTVTEPHTISVKFEILEFTLEIVGADNAITDPSSPVTISYGGEQTVYIKAKPGYKLTSVKVNDSTEDVEEMPLDEITFKLENITEDKTVTVVVEAEEYELVEGENQKFDRENDLTFKFSGDKDLFVALYINDKLVDHENYTVESGSTIITLNKDYLATLEPGAYIVAAKYLNGNTAEVSFEIEKAENPNTLDNVSLYVTLGLISLLGMTSATLYLKKKFN